MTSLNNRKTIRKYQNKEVPSDLLNYLLSISECTQTMGNLQLYSVVATTNTENKARLAPAHFNQPMITQAPVVLTFCADFNRTTQWALRQCCVRHLTLLSNILQYGRNSRLRMLLFGHNALQSRANYRRIKTPCVGYARCNHNTWLAR